MPPIIALTKTATPGRVHSAVRQDLVDLLRDGPLCAKCIATRRQLTLYAVALAIASLHPDIVADSVVPCGQCCGSRGVAALRVTGVSGGQRAA